MKTILAKLSLMVSLSSVCPHSYSQPTEFNMRLGSIASVFEGCVGKEIPKIPEVVQKLSSRSKTETINYVVQGIFAACIDRLSADEAQGRLMLNYSGNVAQSNAFIEGLLYAHHARIYAVASTEIDKLTRH